MPSSKGSSQPRDWTQVYHIAGGFSTIWTTGKYVWYVCICGMYVYMVCKYVYIYIYIYIYICMYISMSFKTAVSFSELSGLWILEKNTIEVNVFLISLYQGVHDFNFFLVILSLITCLRGYLLRFSTTKMLFPPYHILFIGGDSLNLDHT